MQLLDDLETPGHAPRNAIVYSAAIGACEEAKEWRQALHLLRRLGAAADLVAWNATLAALARGGQWQMAVAMLWRRG